MTFFGEKSGQNLSGRKERETASEWKIKRIFAITASPWLPALGVETQDCTSQGELKVQDYHKIFEKYVAFVKIFKFMFIVALINSKPIYLLKTIPFGGESHVDFCTHFFIMMMHWRTPSPHALCVFLRVLFRVTFVFHW